MLFRITNICETMNIIVAVEKRDQNLTLTFLLLQHEFLLSIKKKKLDRSDETEYYLILIPRNKLEIISKIVEVIGFVLNIVRHFI